jgi:hypothetical protein
LLLLPAPFMLRTAMADKTEELLVAWFDVEALGYTFVSQATGFTVGPSMASASSCLGSPSSASHSSRSLGKPVVAWTRRR